MFRKTYRTASKIGYYSNIHSTISRKQLEQFSLSILARPCSQKSSSTGSQDLSSQQNDYSNSTHLSWRQYLLGVGVAAAVAYIFDRKHLQVKAASPPVVGKENLRAKYNFIADVVEKVAPAVVLIQNRSFFRQGCGSGFIITSDGLIVTNAHVVQSAKHDKVQVELANGKKYTGEVQVIDTASDLALLKIQDTNLPAIQLAASDTLRPGEWVVAVGSPLSLSNTVTSGIVSSIGRKSSELGLRNSINYIQTDAPITFGNSGGPLINLDGEAVGVNSMKVTEGISFAIPSDYVKEFLAKAKDFKREKEMLIKSRPPYLGISTITLTPHLAAQLKNRIDIKDLNIDRGVFVVDVNPGSPAQQAGVVKYDIIMKVDDKVVNEFDDLTNAIRDKRIAKFVIYRGGTIMEVHVRVASQGYL